MLYVVRRAFKNYGVAYTPGMVVDPSTIKMFKSKLRDHVIVDVQEKDFDKWNEYFVRKFGVEIQLPVEEPPVEEPPVEEPPVEEPPVEEPPVKPVVVAAVVKK